MIYARLEGKQITFVDQGGAVRDLPDARVGDLDIDMPGIVSVARGDHKTFLLDGVQFRHDMGGAGEVIYRRRPRSGSAKAVAAADLLTYFDRGGRYSTRVVKSVHGSYVDTYPIGTDQACPAERVKLDDFDSVVRGAIRVFILSGADLLWVLSEDGSRWVRPNGRTARVLTIMAEDL